MVERTCQPSHAPSFASAPPHTQSGLALGNYFIRSRCRRPNQWIGVPVHQFPLAGFSAENVRHAQGIYAGTALSVACTRLRAMATVDARWPFVAAATYSTSTVAPLSPPAFFKIRGPRHP